MEINFPRVTVSSCCREPRSLSAAFTGSRQDPILAGIVLYAFRRPIRSVWGYSICCVCYVPAAKAHPLRNRFTAPVLAPPFAGTKGGKTRKARNRANKETPVVFIASVVSPRPKRFRKESGRLEAREKSETFSRSKSAKHPI